LHVRPRRHIQNRRGWQDIYSFQISEPCDYGIGEAQTDSIIVVYVPEQAQREHGERGAVELPNCFAARMRVIVRALGDIGPRVERAHNANGTDEPVAFADHGFQESLLARIIPQCAANLADDVIDVPFGVDEQIRLPKPGYDFLAGYQLLATAHQKNQKLHGLSFELDSVTVPAKLVPADVELNLSGV
jgi:hypothetical protein